MAKLLKLRRGTTSQHSSFTGAEGEVTVDTTKDTVVVHDGTTAGGTPLATESALNSVNTDLVNDTSPQLGGDLDVNGKSIDLADSSGGGHNEINIGAGAGGVPDLKIMSNGSGAFLEALTGTTLSIDGSVEFGGAGNIEIDSKNIIFGDSSDGASDDVLKFGVGTDLSIYSNGSEGILGIPDGGTLKVKDGSNTLVTFSGASNQVDFHNQVVFIGNSSNAAWDFANNRFSGTITEVNVTANNSTDETVYPVFVDGATGSQGAETDTGFTYNPSTGDLTATKFTGALVGNADTATNANVADTLDVTGTNTASGNSGGWYYPIFTDNTGAGKTVYNDLSGQLAFNPATNVLSATNFSGALTGNVTGNVSGSSGSCTGNAATATQLATARNIGGVSFNGTAAINLPGVNAAGNQDTSGTAANATNATNATNASNVTVSDESSDTTCYPLFVTTNTGTIPPKVGTNLTFNSATGELEADILKDSKGDVRTIPFGWSSSQYTCAKADVGKAIEIDNGAIVPSGIFAAGDVITLINGTGSDMTITQGSGIWLRNSMDAGATGNRTLGARGMCTIYFKNGTDSYISGAGLS